VQAGAQFVSQSPTPRILLVVFDADDDGTLRSYWKVRDDISTLQRNRVNRVSRMGYLPSPILLCLTLHRRGVRIFDLVDLHTTMLLCVVVIGVGLGVLASFERL
jgi:hypothetical protein